MTNKKHKDSENVTISKTTLWKGTSAILMLLLVVSIFTSGFGLNSNSAEAEKAQPVKEAEAPVPKPTNNPSPTPSVDMEALMDDDAVKGDENAPVTIVEWSDFECPFCTRFYEQTLGLIDEQYIQTGKVKLVYRDYPLGFHPNAQKAAEAAECADEQDMFWEMHDLLFERGVTGGTESFKQFAVDLGLNANEFNDCLDSGEMAAEVAKDMQDGQAAGIRGTPGFIINGQLVSGAQPFANFKQVIDAELAKVN
jgi:protein-disulfide isomerase